MVMIKRDWDVLSGDERRLAAGELIGYFEKERGERIGAVAAGQILDLCLRVTHRPIYNEALDDVKLLLEKSFGGVLLDIDVALRKSGG